MPVPLALALKVSVVPAMLRIVVPGGMFGPDTTMPTANPAAESTVTVGLLSVVVVATLPLMFGGTEGAFQVPTSVCPNCVVKFWRQGGCATAVVASRPAKRESA